MRSMPCLVIRGLLAIKTDKLGGMEDLSPPSARSRAGERMEKGLKNE